MRSRWLLVTSVMLGFSMLGLLAAGKSRNKVCAEASPALCQQVNCTPGDYQCNIQGEVASCYTSEYEAQMYCPGVCFAVNSCNRTCAPCDTAVPSIDAACQVCNSLNPVLCVYPEGKGMACLTEANAVDPQHCESCCTAVPVCHVCQRDCTDEECGKCGGTALQMCTSVSPPACSDQPHFFPNPACKECCSRKHCPPQPTPPPPCENPDLMNCAPWGDVVICNASEPPFMSPSPAATPYGAFDVSNNGCTVNINSQSCCGYFPRFNWILSTCYSDTAKRSSFACVHPWANTSGLNVNYVAAYQWNGSAWILDPTSSAMQGSKEFDDLVVGTGGDWDIKFGTRTESHKKSQGLGPPAMMFVVSAERFSWSAFYVLNQITVNRGPGGQYFPDNCWSSSSGEFDFFESPFWGGVELDHDRLYFTTTADSGRCIPTAKTITSAFAEYCSSPDCCMMCDCQNITTGAVCFGNASGIGREPMGCAHTNATIADGFVVFNVTNDNLTCARHFGAVGGGADSSSYYRQPNADGDLPMIYVGVIDGDGVTTYRWLAEDATVWPGISRFEAAAVLEVTRPTRAVFQAPCNTTEPCAIHQMSCPGDCPVIQASGVYGKDQLSGAWAAEAARRGMNWWDLFNSTGQTAGRLLPSDLPHFELAKTIPQTLPFNCSHDCGAFCANQTCDMTQSPFLCTKGDGYGGCSNISTAWPWSGRCFSCCNVASCEFSCTGVCDNEQYEKFCNPANVKGCATDQYVCTSGEVAVVGQCANGASTWGQAAGCLSCCQCDGGQRRKSTEAPTHPAPTEAPWTRVPTPSPPTPIPQTPSPTPAPRHKCDPRLCANCPPTDPFVCTASTTPGVVGGCSPQPWQTSGANTVCEAQCDC